jgi:hypothetical protein
MAMTVFVLLMVMSMTSLGRLRRAFRRCNDKRAGKIGAEDGEEK